ncbi:MAG: EamA family transporter [Enterovirga sp.]|nr:EamA family transporter [Enterovirga sp.]
MPEWRSFVERRRSSQGRVGAAVRARRGWALSERDGEPAQESAAARAESGRRRFVAILLMCGAVFCFACLDASAKWANQIVDPMLTTWFRYTANVAILAVVLNSWTRPRILRTNRFALQIGRSVLLFLSTVLNFLALQHLQLAQNISIQFAMPLLVALLAGPMLGEWAGPRRLVAIVIGFCGVLVVARPGGDALHPAALLTVINTVFYALYAIFTRMLAAHDSTATTLTYSGLAGMLFLTPALPFIWTTPPSLLVWAVLIATGLFAAVGHGFLTLAHARAPAPVLSPFIYTQIVWMVLFGYVIFGDVPDRWTLIGGAIVIGSGLYLLVWERFARGRERRPT